MIVIVMGASGAGKTTIGRALAERLDAPFLDADDFHPEANIRKMASGVPLDDADRRPWLERLRVEIRERLDTGDAAVLACSALKRSYRDVLRGAGPGRRRKDGPIFVHLDVPRDELRARLERRAAGGEHFMPPGLVESQLATLEPPEPEEGAIVVDAGAAPGEVVERIVARLPEEGAARA